MESSIRHCVINCGIGSWYPKGSERLAKSLNYHGYSGDVFTWRNFPNKNYDESCLYNVKAAAFEEAIAMGYTHILWMDCSAWCIGNIEPIFDIINEMGYFLLRSGYNCAQTCSDKCLESFDVTRDIAESFNDASSGVMGVNTQNPEALLFIQKFIKSAKDGVFSGSKNHDGQSEDHRFLFHRHDQSAAGIIANQMGLYMFDLNIHVSYYSPKMPETTIIALRGL